MAKHIEKQERNYPVRRFQATTNNNKKSSYYPLVDNSPQAIQMRQLKAHIQEQQKIDPFFYLRDTTTLQKKENKTGLPDDLKTGVENLSGFAMDDVNVHYNSPKPAQLQAHAYAQGTDIHLAPGQEKHLPHEAWHVVQQKQGRVQPTMQMKAKVNINDDPKLEKEADVMGAKALDPNSSSHASSKESLQKVALENETSTAQRWPFSKKISVGDSGRTNKDGVTVHIDNSKMSNAFRKKAKGLKVGILKKGVMLKVVEHLAEKEKVAKNKKLLVEVPVDAFQNGFLRQGNLAEENEDQVNFVRGYVTIKHIDFGRLNDDDEFIYDDVMASDKDKKEAMNKVFKEMNEDTTFINNITTEEVDKKGYLIKQVIKKALEQGTTVLSAAGKTISKQAIKLADKKIKTALEKHLAYIKKNNLDSDGLEEFLADTGFKDKMKLKVQSLFIDLKTNTFKTLLNQNEIAKNLQRAGNQNDYVYLYKMEAILAKREATINKYFQQGLIDSNQHDFLQNKITSNRSQIQTYLNDHILGSAAYEEQFGADPQHAPNNAPIIEENRMPLEPIIEQRERSTTNLSDLVDENFLNAIQEDDVQEEQVDDAIPEAPLEEQQEQQEEQAPQEAAQNNANPENVAVPNPDEQYHVFMRQLMDLIGLRGEYANFYIELQNALLQDNPEQFLMGIAIEEEDDLEAQELRNREEPAQEEEDERQAGMLL